MQTMSKKNALLAARESLGATQEQVSQMAGLPVRTIQRLEQSLATVGPDTLESIINGLDQVGVAKSRLAAIIRQAHTGCQRCGRLRELGEDL